jgi:hypothetical protein
MMTLRNMASILKMLGFKADAGDHTMILKDRYEKIAMIEFDSFPESKQITLLRDSYSRTWEFSKDEFVNLEILKLTLDIAGGLI